MACLPAVAVGLLLRAWVTNSTLTTLSADEAITGLQGYDLLNGHPHLIVAGNHYGGTVESYLVAPLLTFWGGPGPLRLVSVLLSLLAAAALAWAARPLLGRVLATTVGLVSFVVSGALVVVWTLSYMGYPSGGVALAVTLGCATRLMTDRPGRWLALGTGFAAGFAIWCHPMFGAVAALLLVAPVVRHRRSLRVWVAVVVGGLAGVSPWLVFLARNGLPNSPPAARPSSYLGRLWIFVSELLPRAFGIRLTDDAGSWVAGAVVGVVLSVLLTGGALAGLVVLVRRIGRPALPVCIAGWAAFPVLAVFPTMSWSLDARYSLPFMPMLLIGLCSWLLLLPVRVRGSLWLPVLVPLVWAALACVPQIEQRIGWTWQNPNVVAQQLTDEVQASGMTAIAGDYWGVYLFDYLSADRLDAGPYYPIRFSDELDAARATPPGRLAYVFLDDQIEIGFYPAPLPPGGYDVITGDRFRVWIPR